jgi:radical SAM protein with 4Fe4S-binding SPASM domain
MFKRIYIEITNVCNLSCSFCPKSNSKAEFMSVESFEEILRKIEGQAKVLYFHVKGEPLLHPDLGVFLDLCERYHFKVNLTTNGTLIDKSEKSVLNKPALRQINFSLHSFDANYDKYPIEQYLEKIFRFIRNALYRQKLLIGLRLWNVNEENKNNEFILNRIKEEFKLDFNIKNEVSQINGIKVADYVFLYQAQSFDWPDLNNEIIGEKGFCYGLRDQIAILSDGTVVPCCLDSEGIIDLGNIFRKDFEEIVESDRAKKIYDGFSKRQVVEELCKKCNYRERFSLGNR